MNAPATPGGETPDISFCPEIDRYTVLQGETAADVQLKKDVNRHTLETANPDVNLDALQAGQVLCVPENQACPPGNTYTLDKDETMETTALLLNVSLSALLRQIRALRRATSSKARASIFRRTDRKRRSAGFLPC